MTEEEYRLKLIKQRQNQLYYQRHRERVIEHNTAYNRKYRAAYIAYGKAYRKLTRNGEKVELPKIAECSISPVAQR